MPMSCSVLGCPSRYSKGKNITFFHFPLKNKKQLAAWLNAIKRQNWTPSKYDRICNEHFTVNDYLHRPDAHYTHLKSMAVPSIFPSSTKSNKRNKIIKTNNENEKDEIDDVEGNNKSHVENFTNTHIEIDGAINQDVHSSQVNIQTDENIENAYTIVDVTEEPKTYNENNNVNMETCDPETVTIEEPCVTSIYEPNEIEGNQINDNDSDDAYNLDSSDLHCIKNSPIFTKINLRHKIRMLQQKVHRRDARIIYLQRVLTNLEQKKQILSAIQRL